MGELIHEELSQEIIGAAMTVLNALKPGLDACPPFRLVGGRREKLYENALVIELQERGHSVNQQKLFKVEYKGHEIGRMIPDLIVDDLVIADPKVVSAFNETHVAQMTGYLALTGLRLALLLNFRFAKLQWRRVVR